MSLEIPTPEPRIARFERLAYGLFLHWGLYSLLGRGEWVMEIEKISKEEYAPLADRFTAEEFDARKIARMARKAGMRYITLTTRHHDGFSLYDTRGLSDFDAPHSAAGRDLVAEFIEACRGEDLMPVLYHTTMDWQWDSQRCDEATFNEYLDYLHASVETLCTQYGSIGGLWFDGNWSRKDADWKEDRLYGLIRKHQPEAMIINNSGMSNRGFLGHPELDSTTFEQGLPKPVGRRGHPKYVSGEMCQTMNAHWGIGFHDFNYKSVPEIIENLCLCRKAGANYLLNVGPTATGAIPAYEAAALERAGDWLELFGEPIYDGVPVDCACQGRDFVLEANGAYYYVAFGLNVEGDKNVTVAGGGNGPRNIQGLGRTIRSARWMDNDEALGFIQDTEGDLVTVNLTGYPYGTHCVVRIAKLTV